MFIRLCGVIAEAALVAACHGTGQSNIPDPMSNPGMNFRATRPLSVSRNVTLEPKCADPSTAPANCTKHPAR